MFVNTYIFFKKSNNFFILNVHNDPCFEDKSSSLTLRYRPVHFSKNSCIKISIHFFILAPEILDIFSITRLLKISDIPKSLFPIVRIPNSYPKSSQLH